MTENEMIGWYYGLNEHEFEQALGDSEGQQSLGCCSSWGCGESDTSERLNNSNADIRPRASSFSTGAPLCLEVLLLIW